MNDVIAWLMGYGPCPDKLWAKPAQLPEDWDPNAPMPPWVAKLDHVVIEYEGYSVPAYAGDTERIEWERAHGLRN